MDIAKNYSLEVLVDRALKLASDETDWTSFQQYQALMLAALLKQGESK